MKPWTGQVPEENHIALHYCKYPSAIDDCTARIKEYGDRRVYMVKTLIETWKDRQFKYEQLAEKHKDEEHNYTKFTYKAIATRDCWKELMKEIK